MCVSRRRKRLLCGAGGGRSLRSIRRARARVVPLRLVSGWCILRRGGEAHRESNFSMSACEYAAPTTRLDSRGVFLGPLAGDALRQNGAVELLVNQHTGDPFPEWYDDRLYLLRPVYVRSWGNRSAGQSRCKRTDMTYQLGPSPAAQRQSTFQPGNAAEVRTQDLPAEAACCRSQKNQTLQV